MKSLLDWLLNQRTLRFGQGNVEFGFAHPLPGWAWAVILLGAIALAWWSYRRLEGGRRWRIALGAVRAALLMLLVVLIAGPRLVKANESDERDWVLVLVDRSASMGIKDAPPVDSGAAATPGTRRTSRDDELRAVLESSSAVWRTLARDRTLVWLGFDSGAYDLGHSADPGAPPAPVDLKPPAGRQTALGRALEQALRRAAARPLSGVVIFSDGRSIDEPARALVRRLQADHVPILVFPLGSSEPVADIAVRNVQGPRTAFVNDFVPVEVEVEQLGGAPGAQPGKAKAQLIDQATGLVLDEQDVDFADSNPPTPGPRDSAGAKPVPAERTAHLTLTTKAAAAGKPKWTVRVVPAGPDLVSENNSAPVTVEMIDRPIRVAYFDGYPRWEYRYLKNLLVREKSFTASTLILSSGRRYVQEGEQTMTALPRSPEEWALYDVIVMGDVRPEVFTPEQLNQIKEHVAVRGAGLLWIGGEGPTPVAWRSTALADLLPMVIGESIDQGIRSWDRPVNMAPTPLAERLGVLRLSTERRTAPNAGTIAPGESWWPAGLADPDAGWSTLRWAQRIDPGALKPTAEVLAIGRARRAGAGGPPGSGGTEEFESAPLVVSMRFGAGRVVYVGTDEVWRWRYGRGELYPERFWLQMIRLLGRESLSRAAHGAILEVSPRRAEVDQAVRIAVQLVDQSLVDTAPGSLHVRLIRDERPLPGEKMPEGDRPAAAELRLLPETAGAGNKGVRTFAATWVAAESGRYRVDVDDPFLARGGAGAGDSLVGEVEVWLPDDELRHPETDHPLLARLAKATDGEVLKNPGLEELPRLLPNRGIRLAGEPEVQTLWDTPLALILTVLLLTVEWVGRRLLRLA